MDSQKILVTGGAGFIGTNLCNKLRTRGQQVLVVDLLNNERGDYQWIFDQHDFDYVYHLAVEYGRWNGEDYYKNLWQTNCLGTKHMLRLQEVACVLNVPCVEELIRRIIYPTPPVESLSVQNSGSLFEINNA